jgi:mono/diheme cytochrome c family protein
MGAPKITLLLAALAVAMAGSMFPVSAARQEKEKAAPAALPGQAVYNDTCSRCHGPEGQGGKAPWLVPFRWNYAQATDIIRHGGACGMPGFPESELSDQDIHEIVDYLKSFN